MDQARNGNRTCLQGQPQSLSLGAAEQTNNIKKTTSEAMSSQEKPELILEMDDEWPKHCQGGRT